MAPPAAPPGDTPASIERLYSAGRYLDAMTRGKALLEAGEDAGVRLFAGLGAYEAGEVTSAVTHLLAAIRGGRNVHLPVVHRHERLAGSDEFCHGELVLGRDGVEYRGSQPGHAFTAAYARVSEVSVRSLSLQREATVRLRLEQAGESGAIELAIAGRPPAERTPCGDCGAKAIVVARLLEALK